MGGFHLNENQTAAPNKSEERKKKESANDEKDDVKSLAVGLLKQIYSYTSAALTFYTCFVNPHWAVHLI